MLRIRRISDTILAVDRETVQQVQEILRAQFSGLSAAEVEALPGKLHNPFKLRFRPLLFVAENGRRKVLGFALLLYEPELRFAYLEYIAAGGSRTGGGIGGGLYQRVREAAVGLGARGIFLECLPADPDAYPPEIVAQNVARLRFYERYGARPIVGTAYETPVNPGDKGPPHLVFDGLERREPLDRAFVRRAVKEILERKYGDLCSPEYVRQVVASITDDPVRLGDLRYVKPQAVASAVRPGGELIPMVVNDRHDIHHIRERGYVEAPVRIASILAELEPTGLFQRLPPREHAERCLKEVHDPALVDYLRRACRDVPPGKSLYPYVFPIRNRARLPKERSVLAGYYCIDTFTPIHQNAFPAGPARRRLRADRRGADPRRLALRLRSGAPAWPPRRAALVRRLLLLQQRGDRRPRAEPHRQGGDPRRRLPPRQRPAGHLLPPRRRADGVDPRPPALRLPLLLRFRRRARRGRRRGRQPQPAAARGARRPAVPAGAGEGAARRPGLRPRLPGRRPRPRPGQGRPHRHLVAAAPPTSPRTAA